MSNKYQNAKIYKMVNTEMPNVVYYGSTCKELNRRLSEHKAPSNTCTSKKLFEVGNPQIILIENFPCSSRIELEQRERFYIENNECINKHIPNRTQKEYYQDNREQIIERRKQYKEDNKQKILEQKNQKHNCQCGGKFTNTSKARHFKTKIHKDYIESL